ncbi:hypothetical protein ABIF94_005752 [Bradyrhizobium ottawaense]
MIAHLKLQTEKLNRDRYGRRSERIARLLDQLESTLEGFKTAATEDEFAAEIAAAKTTKVASFTRKRPSRQAFPAHLPRERVIVPGARGARYPNYLQAPLRSPLDSPA